MSAGQLATEQHWCICGAHLKITDDQGAKDLIRGFFWLVHDGPGHKTTDLLTAARARHRHNLEVSAHADTTAVRSQRDFLARRTRP